MRQVPISPPAEGGQSPQKALVLIDTDIGDVIADALALVLALASPELEVLGVTTVSGDTTRRAHLAAQLLATYGRADIAVAAGSRAPLQPPRSRHRPSTVPQAAILAEHAEYPTISSDRGADLILATARKFPGRLNLICIGPLTNIALALQSEPGLYLNIQRIVMMGGTSGWPFPEWNIRSDARAAQIVLGAGIPVTMLGWNITTHCQLQALQIELLRADPAPHIQLLSRLLALWQRQRPRWHPKLLYLHDPLTIVALCAPELLRFEETTARIFTRGPLTGFMVARHLDGPLLRAAVDIQVEQARQWIMQRLLAPSIAQSP